MTGKPHNNTNPRKFKEKIELLRQKEAQLTANFLEVMRGIPNLTRNVVLYSDLANKDLSPSCNTSSPPRISSDAFKSSRYTRGLGNYSAYQYALESNTGTTNRSPYNNSGGTSGVGDGGSTSNKIPRTSGSATDTQSRPPQATQERGLETSKSGSWSCHQAEVDSGGSGLISQISPMSGPQGSPPPSVAYQPNLAPISVSPHSPSASSLPPTSSNTTGSTASNPAPPDPTPAPDPPPQFYATAELSPSGVSAGGEHIQRQQFHPPPPPPPPQSTSKATGYGYADLTVAGANGIPGGMSLMDYRRTYSDSCIPSSFLEPNRHFQQSLQYPNNQQLQNHPPLPSPPSGFQQPLQRTLPPVNELTLPRYQHLNSWNASSINSAASGSYFNERLSLSPRCRHQSSITVSHQHQQHQPWRKLQPDYHSMRNIPQRYAPIHHNQHQNHTGGMMPIQQQPMMMETYEYQNTGANPLVNNNSWGINGGENGFSVSECDLPSSMSTSRLRRSDACNQFRSKPQAQPPLLQPLPQMPCSMCYASYSTTTSGSGDGYNGSNRAGAFLAYHHHHHHHRHQQQSHPSSVLCLGVGGTNGTINNNVMPSSQTPLTQAQDISTLSSDAFPSPEQEGRRDSFSMAVDLLSRLEKRPLDTSSCNSTVSPPVIPVTPIWSNSVSPPPSKSAKFDPSSATVANPGPNFYVPIAEKDLQLLTEPSMVNYVTDAATEDQLVREQYSPS